MSHDFDVISIWLARVPSLFSLPASYLQSILQEGGQFDSHSEIGIFVSLQVLDFPFFLTDFFLDVNNRRSVQQFFLMLLGRLTLL